MDWQFWKKLSKASGKSEVEKLSKPKEINEQIGMYLVSVQQKDPDWVWSLKMVERTEAGNKSIKYFRVFDPTQLAEVKFAIKDFYSFNEHPELLLYEGTIDRNTKKLQVEVKSASADEVKAA